MPTEDHRSLRRSVFAAVLGFLALAALTSPASAEVTVRATRGAGCAPPLQAGTAMPPAPRVDASGNTRPERSVGTAYDRDPDVARRIAVALRAEPKLADTSIWVEARQQLVTLRGCVRKPEQRAVAEGIARRTMGVLRVVNETRVIAGSVRPLPVELEPE